MNIALPSKSIAGKNELPYSTVLGARILVGVIASLRLLADSLKAALCPPNKITSLVVTHNSLVTSFICISIASFANPVPV